MPAWFIPIWKFLFPVILLGWITSNAVKKHISSVNIAVLMQNTILPIETADSLAQQESNIQISRKQTNWNISLLLRYRRIYHLYTLQALRFISSSSGKGFLPALNLHSTFSTQEYDIDDYRDGTWQYHQGDVPGLGKYCICVLKHSTTF